VITMRRLMVGGLVLSTMMMGMALTASAQPPTGTNTAVSAAAGQKPVQKKTSQHATGKKKWNFRHARKPSQAPAQAAAKGSKGSKASHKTGDVAGH